MSRYKNTFTRKSSGKGVRKYIESHNSYATTMYVNVPEDDTDIYVTTQEGDRLDILATQFYKDPSLWWFIARTNNLKTIHVPAGTSLRISQLLHLAKGF